MRELVDYLRREAGRSGAFGDVNCAFFATGWAEARTGRDPAAELHGKFNTEAEAEQLYAHWGGLAALAGRLMRRAGFRLTKHPKPGDIAVILVGGRLCCAIRTERFFAARLDGPPTLIRTDQARVVLAWSV